MTMATIVSAGVCVPDRELDAEFVVRMLDLSTNPELATATPNQLAGIAAALRMIVVQLLEERPPAPLPVQMRAANLHDAVRIHRERVQARTRYLEGWRAGSNDEDQATTAAQEEAEQGLWAAIRDVAAREFEGLL